MPKQLWIMESDDRGEDFTDSNSGNTYQVGNLTDAVEAESRAIEEGTDVIWYNGSIDPETPYEVESGQKFVIGEFELDSQGVQYQPKGDER